MADFAELVKRESAGLHAAVVVIVGDRHRAEEIVQEAFERCFRRWRSVAKLDRPGAWVRRVAINEAISHTRRRSAEQRALVRLPTGGQLRGVEDVSAVLDADIWTAVRQLPTEQATAIALRYGADLSIDQVAETMELTPAAVKSLLYRARSTLRGATDLQELA